MTKKIITAVFAFFLFLGVFSLNATAQTNKKGMSSVSKKSMVSNNNNAYQNSPSQLAAGRQMTQNLNDETALQADYNVEEALPVIHQYFYDEIIEIKIPAKHERRISQTAIIQTGEDFYSKFKNDVKELTGLTYGFDWSFTAQRGAPDGKQTSMQNIYYPYAQLDLFNSKSWLGDAQINFNYTLVRYWGMDAGVLGDRIAVVTPVNDYPTRQDLFSQLTFNHTWGGDFSWLSWAIGQYPMYNFDGTTYDSNQQTGLINYSLSQNASSTYPQASFGGYVEITPVKEVTIAGGYQDATNIDGEIIDMDTAFDGKFLGFGSLTYSPTVGELGAGQYAALFYYQPSVEEQEGYSMGWSINIEQNLTEKWVVFGRANGSTRDISPIQNSYVLGFSFVNPLNRNPLDVITFASAYNKMAEGDFSDEFVRTGEAVFEAQWVWGLTPYLTVTPDIQLYNRAALNADSGWISVFTLRATVMI